MEYLGQFCDCLLLGLTQLEQAYVGLYVLDGMDEILGSHKDCIHQGYLGVLTLVGENWTVSKMHVIHIFGTYTS